MAKKIGIMGGTFDPVHIAHLILAENVCDICGLDKVIFIPSGNPPHKDPAHASASDRYEMVRLAVSENPHFDVLPVERDRKGPSYSILTIRELHFMYPDDRLYFLIGSDELAILNSWYMIDEIISMCGFIAVGRPGNMDDDKSLMYMKEKGTDVHMINMPLIEISSTDIRQRIHEGRTIRYMVPDAVLDYIGRKCLYK
ncbi:MAG: nicotinate-nucleotide adenylyltransferase [Veillonellaceae bacterium]|nr:nicotinate-nucleotide adenylyltransferase [Veillonellaceae bacterium]MDD6923064.1 nicotinate-nucleotide adenylyltransferase [Veillonellaceae bacterium]